MITFKLIKGKSSTWHINHSQASCRHAGDIIDHPKHTKSAIVDAERSKELGMLYLWICGDPPDRVSSYYENICQLCSKNFLDRLMILPPDDVYLHRGH